MLSPPGGQLALVVTPTLTMVTLAPLCETDLLLVRPSMAWRRGAHTAPGVVSHRMAQYLDTTLTEVEFVVSRSSILQRACVDQKMCPRLLIVIIHVWYGRIGLLLLLLNKFTK